MDRHRIKLSIFFLIFVGCVAYYLYRSHSEGLNPLWVPSPGVDLVAPPPTREPDLYSTDLTPSELGSRPDVQTCRQTANSLLVKLKRTSDQFGLHFGGAAAFEPSGGSLEDSYGYSTIKLKSGDFWFDFARPDLGTRSFISDAYEHTVDGINSSFTSKPDEAKWNSNYAIQVASAYLGNLVDRGDVLWGPPHAKYDHIHMDLPKYYEGTWMVTWPRIDGHGHSYASQGARLEISETWGLMNATLWFDKTFVEQKGAVMPAEKAVAIAESLHPSMGTPSDDIIGYSVKSSELMIVAPYNVGGYPSRLAWVIWLQPTRSPGSKTFLGYDDGQEVTVDALTGQILGTDSWL